MSSSWLKNGFVYVLILVAAVALFFSFFPPSERPSEVGLTTVAEWARRGEIVKITVSEDELEVLRKGSDKPVLSRKEYNVSIAETLARLGVSEEQIAAIDLEVKAPSPWASRLTILGSLLPLVFVAALFFFLMRQAQTGNNQAISFAKSRARLFTGNKPTVTFDDVAGVEEAKEELQE
ncbi:MAG: ATP-dependent zinc metalloprotease FtsH, partial [Anaerolineae bacterium]